MVQKMKVFKKVNTAMDAELYEVEQIRISSRTGVYLDSHCGTMKPQRAAEIILNGVEKGKRNIIVGRDAKQWLFWICTKLISVILG